MLPIQLNVLNALRADFEASVAQAAAKLKVTRMLELKGLERRLEAEQKHSQEVSSIAEGVRAQYQKCRDDLEAVKHQVEEIKQTLAAAKDREAELSQALEASRSDVNATKEQVQIASTLVLSFEEEQKKKTLPSEEEIKPKAQECLYHDKAEKVKALKDQIRRMANLQ